MNEGKNPFKTPNKYLSNADRSITPDEIKKELSTAPKTQPDKKVKFTPEFIKECAEIIPKNDKIIVLKQEKEVFLRYYVQGQATRNNAMRSYMLVKNLNEDDWSKEDRLEEVQDEYGKFSTVKKPRSSEWYRRTHSCQVAAHDWLCQPKVNARRMQLTTELLKDSIIDNELAKVIIQDEDLGAKNVAIKEYNKLAKRIVDQKDVRMQSVGLIKHLYDEADGLGSFDED